MAEWFKLHPIRIIKDGKRIRYRENRIWASANPELSRRINLALFMDPMVFAYLLKHPARVVEKGNFIIGTSGEVEREMIMNHLHELISLEFQKLIGLWFQPQNGSLNDCNIEDFIDIYHFYRENGPFVSVFRYWHEYDVQRS